MDSWDTQGVPNISSVSSFVLDDRVKPEVPPQASSMRPASESPIPDGSTDRLMEAILDAQNRICTRALTRARQPSRALRG